MHQHTDTQHVHDQHAHHEHSSDPSARVGYASPAEARAWIRGLQPIFQDARTYFSAVPRNEFDKTITWRVVERPDETEAS